MQEVLRSLVMCYSKWSGKDILYSMLNGRGHKPERQLGLVHKVIYPEPGVVRCYVSEPRIHAWCDTVVSREKFHI